VIIGSIVESVRRRSCHQTLKTIQSCNADTLNWIEGEEKKRGLTWHVKTTGIFGRETEPEGGQTTPKVTTLKNKQKEMEKTNAKIFEKTCAQKGVTSVVKN